MQYRTHTCNELRLADAGKQVRLSGWMENVREVSGNLAFIVLRDFYGSTQLVAEDEKILQVFLNLNKESVVSVTGTVRERRAPDEIKTDILKEYGLKKEDTENPKNWAITRETWGISFDTKDGSWYFEVDAYTGEILDKEIPDGK